VREWNYELCVRFPESPGHRDADRLYTVFNASARFRVLPNAQEYSEARAHEQKTIPSFEV
jgi:hypothetical protein